MHSSDPDESSDDELTEEDVHQLEAMLRDLDEMESEVNSIREGLKPYLPTTPSGLTAAQWEAMTSSQEATWEHLKNPDPAFRIAALRAARKHWNGASLLEQTYLQMAVFDFDTNVRAEAIATLGFSYVHSKSPDVLRFLAGAVFDQGLCETLRVEAYNSIVMMARTCKVDFVLSIQECDFEAIRACIGTLSQQTQSDR